MKISTRGRYATRMLLDLAQHLGGGYVALKDIAERQDISKKYLEQIIPLLRKAGILHTTRGFQGGYMLAKQPGDITMGEILRVTEGSLAPVACLEDESGVVCVRSADCPTLPVWVGLQKVMSEYLDGITLEDLMTQTGHGDDYVI
ncbi:MAG: Rrf2 family transcriptional regulator [Oscillospiraceae bacterium]|jgi:Rrf2 family protein|nr:Rrf2 family transcriptional regulator [Oscillospiraceae bacterium]